LNFGWQQKPPSPKPKVFSPIRGPPGWSSFHPDVAPIDIFATLCQTGFELWLAATNEAGTAFYASERAQLLADAQISGEPVARRIKRWSPVTEAEGWRFLAVLTYINVVRMSRLDSYWNTDMFFASLFVKTVMKEYRFKEIKRFTRMYKISLMAESGLSHADMKKRDPIYKMRPMMELLLKSFRLHRVPRQHLALDEQMVKFKVRSI